MFNLGECVVKSGRARKKCLEFGKEIVKTGGLCGFPKGVDIPSLCCPTKVRCCKPGLLLNQGVCEHELLLYIKYPSCNGSRRGIGAVKCERFGRLRHYRSGGLNRFSKFDVFNEFKGFSWFNRFDEFNSDFATRRLFLD